MNQFYKPMKKALFLLLCFVFSHMAFGQNIYNTAYSTNGRPGESLFKEDGRGNIVYQEVIYSSYSADTILGLAREYLYSIEKKYKASVSNRFEGVTKVACDIELPVGVKYIDAGYAGTWAKAAATVTFNLIIDIRPGKYRYTLSNFETDRWRIPGEGKDKGQSNVIHWQRVNSLRVELASAKKKDQDEIREMIRKEEISYKNEYEAVMSFIEGLKTFAVIDDFDAPTSFQATTSPQSSPDPSSTTVPNATQSTIVIPPGGPNNKFFPPLKL